MIEGRTHRHPHRAKARSLAERAAEKVAVEAEKEANILCRPPDTGEHYLTTPLFVDMSAATKMKKSLRFHALRQIAQLNSLSSHH